MMDGPTRNGRSLAHAAGQGSTFQRACPGVKIHATVDKYGIPLAIDVSPANRHSTKGQAAEKPPNNCSWTERLRRVRGGEVRGDGGWVYFVDAAGRERARR